MATGEKTVLIAGGGAIGLCSAWYAAQRGYRVTVVERNGPDHDGCSTGNAGMIVPSHFVPLAAPGMIAYGLRQMGNPRSPFYIRPRLDPGLIGWGLKFARAATPERVEKAAPLLRDLSLASRSEFECFAERFGDGAPDGGFGLTKRGLLMLCQTEKGLEEEAHAAETAHKLGIPAEVATPERAAQIDPGIRMEIRGAVHYPLDAHLDPRRFLECLTKALVESGRVELRFGAEVTGWRQDGAAGRIAAAVLRGGEEIGADEFVLASGVWAQETVRDLGLKLPMQAGKGYSVTLPNPAKLPQLCSILTEARVAVTPMGGKIRFGGTMELSGLDETIRSERVEGILRSVERYLPDFPADSLRGLPVWKGFRPCSPDGLPYLGRTGRWKNLTVAAGHAMMGLSLGPITGRIVGELLSGESPKIDLTLLSPDRYA